MNDLNCPNCGTTYQSLEAGFCGCCDFEFTAEFIDKFVLAEKEKEEERQRKIDEENRRKKLLIEKAEKERREKAEAQKKALMEAEKARLKERLERERIRTLIENNNKRYEKDKTISAGIKKFRNAMAILGIVLVAAVLIGSVLFTYELDASFIAPQEVIAEKVESVWVHKTIPVKYDEENGVLKKTWKSAESYSIPEWGMSLFNSISRITKNQRTLEEKISCIFPNTTAFIGSLLENSNKTPVDAPMEAVPVDPPPEQPSSVTEGEEVTEITEQNY